MALTPGTRLGPYEILGPAGAGGMGEVYRARDTRLDRLVAIKILPTHIAATEDARARFEREARAVSSLNHPHICTLYDVGRQDDLDYLVMEYIEGETLAVRLSRGPLPLAEVLTLGAQIADALDKAHRQGLVHRDLKPGNVMLTKSGAKLLDFGLARSLHASDGPGALSGATLSRPITVEGTIVGTFQYMAPEQLEGKEADVRSDLWAFGATLYEMATGKPAFEGASQASLISSIMKDTPRPIAEFQPVTPPGLDRIIRQCLAKDPEERVQSAHDVRLQLQWVSEGGSQAGVPAFVGARRRRREAIAIGLAGGSLAVAALAVGWNLTHRPHPLDPVRFQFSQPSFIQFADAPRVSPNGKLVAFSATDSTGKTLIWLRPLRSLDSYSLAGTDNAGRPFWSPDSRYLGFFADGKLKKVGVEGGPPITVCDAATGSDGTWSKHDVILFDGRANDPIYRVPAGGGVPTVAVALDTTKGELSAAWPQFLPDGQHFLFLSAGKSNMLRVGKLGASQFRDVMPCDSRAEYAEPGYVVYSRGGSLVSQPFDAGAGKTAGDPVPVAERVATNAVGGADFSTSENGVLTIATRGGQDAEVRKLDRSGVQSPTVFATGDILHPALSPDGKVLAIRKREAQSATRDIWVIDLARQVSSRLTFDPKNENYPLWSPDGASVLYLSDAAAGPGLYVQSATGAGRSERILASEDSPTPTDWTKDGRYVIFEKGSSATKEDVWMLPLAGDKKPVPLLQGPYDESQARVSPDGHWLLYTSNETGREEVYVQSFPEPSGKWQISTRGGSDAEWSPSGRELYYLSPDQQLMVMPVPVGSTFQVSIPKALFPIRVSIPTGPRNHYAVAADGSIYVVSPLGGQTTNITTVVLNWPAEVAKR